MKNKTDTAKEATMSESLTQMVKRLMKDHGWGRYMALRAAEYYRDELTWTQLNIALGHNKAMQIGNMR
ncbi:MAG: hypothetical protein WC551_12865 [Patescibacteria group bacterium]